MPVCLFLVSRANGLASFVVLFQMIISLIASRKTAIKAIGISIVPINIMAANPQANKKSARNVKQTSLTLLFITAFYVSYQTTFPQRSLKF
jgi:hypothetical protein